MEILIQYQQAMLNTVQKRAIKDLNKLYEYFQTNEYNLRPSPLDLKQLSANMETLERCKNQRTEIENQIKPIQDKFKLLEESAISLKEEDMQRKNNLRAAWTTFQEMLEKIEDRNQKVYQDLYQDTMRNLEEFYKDAGDNKVHFMANAPF